MAFNSRFVKSKKLPMTALFDVVFLLIIFFIVSTTLTGGGEDILGKNEVDTPKEEGNTSSNILIQLFNMNNSWRCFVIGQQDNTEITVLQRNARNREIDVKKKISIIKAFREKKISLIESSNILKEVLINKINEFEFDEPLKGKPEISIALRTEYDVKYVDVLKIINVLSNQDVKELAIINYVLLIGSLNQINNNKGLLDMIKYEEDRPPSPKEVPSINTPKNKRT